MFGLFSKKLPSYAVFAFNTWSRALKIFLSDEELTAACPGIEIAEGDWEFFAADGTSLKPQFSVPVKINFDDKTYSSGVFTLEPADGDTIHSVLGNVTEVEGPSGFRSVADLEKIFGKTAPEKLRA